MDEVHSVCVFHYDLNFRHNLLDEFELSLVHYDLAADWSMYHPVLLGEQNFGALILSHNSRILNC